MPDKVEVMIASQASARGARAFTLIELLIVVTIISILASIAMPNFLEAQMRSKVARTKSDMRTLTTAIEAYRVDGNHYPYRRHESGTTTYNPATPEATKRAKHMHVLTTPVAYLTSLPVDLFEMNVPAPNNLIDYYDPDQTSWLLNAVHPVSTQEDRRVGQGQAGWMLVSVGPDAFLGATSNVCACPLGTSAVRGSIYYMYDPTNGTVSKGNIYDSSFYGMDGGSRLTRQFYAGD